MTKIIIAQRIASVRRADRIVVLEEGRIAACGSHDELMETSSIYQDIYMSQLKTNPEAFLNDTVPAAMTGTAAADATASHSEKGGVQA